jgi:hypothetical protein
MLPLQRLPVDWIPVADEKRARYGAQHGELDERALVRQGNVAYAAALALLMAGDAEAPAWFDRAAARWRESWDAGAPRDAWGRPVGAVKAAVLGGDERAVAELSRWALELGCATAASPIGRYAGVLALLALGRSEEARHVAASLRARDDFPRDVADALAALAAGDADELATAVASVIVSFETRDAHLEDVAVADTALVLHALAALRGLEAALPPSPVLPG